MKQARFIVPLNGRNIGAEPEYLWLNDKIEVIVWKDPELHVVSSICPHMGAQLCLNHNQEILHCPWHGLQFDTTRFKSDHHQFKSLSTFEAALVDGELHVF
ncbi:MAG: Rieske (2Fe-2S) protein [Candidatus Nitrohelix vancouverensis]|uniref:Rieske (2Fe-2S) protein n=1 Tax=Candidatus Nitrohelix vancouverensis TaxID=2705534 RepID=A0A7T0C2F5_9BACT|nr:MAG: Rieske (2Fe-2S) protein [Candidatus Nitrohelix vancouverensis]